METTLRVISLLVGISIIAGLAYDFVRTLKKRKNATGISPQQRAAKIDPAIGLDISVFESVELEPEAESAVLDEKTESKNVDSASATKDTALTAPVVTPDKVIALTVLARPHASFSGRPLLSLFDQLDLTYGDKSIFHAFEGRVEAEPPLFSVASLINPGTFDLKQLDVFNTPGLVFFFVASTLNQSVAAFEAMLRTARLAAQQLGGELRDEARRPLTTRGIELYRERIRRVLSAA